MNTLCFAVSSHYSTSSSDDHFLLSSGPTSSWGSRPLQRCWLLQLLEALVVQTSSPSKWFNQDGSEHNLQEMSCTVQEPPGWSVGCETPAALLFSFLFFVFCNTNRHQIDHQTRRSAVFFTLCSPRLMAAYKKFTWNVAVWLCNFLKGGLLSSCFPLHKSQDPPFFFVPLWFWSTQSASQVLHSQNLHTDLTAP